MANAEPEQGADVAASQSTHEPYVPDNVTLPEFTFAPLLIGTLLGLVFGASSLYLVLKVGMTVSASIPVAVLAITLFRGLSKAFGVRQATILENNIVQTSGSAGESIAFGVGVTMPALLFLGFEMDLVRVMVVSILGGLLGILAMIPLRRAFIVRMHGRPGQPGTLLYPEGVAAAQVLISGEKGGTTGATVFVGFAIAFVHKFLTIGLHLLKETITVPFTAINRAARFAGDAASELLGVGYIIGVRTSSIMMAGAVLGYLVIIPIVYYMGISSDKPIPPADKTIAAWEQAEKANKKGQEVDLVDKLRNNYLLYIGAGCVAAAGIISMGRTLPMIVRSIHSGVASVRGGGPAAAGRVPRTQDDMSMRVVLFGSLGLLALLAAFLVPEVGFKAAIAGALLVLLFGFLFVTVSARLTGEIGSSSNPISGMTVATLMLTCLIFLALGWTSPLERILALSVAGVVCIASSNGGTTAQSLKTGFLVGGTPKYMQYAILIGALVSALVIGGTLLAFNSAGTVYSDDPQYLPADGSGQTVRLTPEELGRLKEKETYQGKEYLIWDTRRDSFSQERNDRPVLLKSPAGTAPEGRFLVDPSTGTVVFLKDPTIGGQIKTRGEQPRDETGQPLKLTAEEMARLNERETLDDKEYLIWDTQHNEFDKERGDRSVLLAAPDGSAREGRFPVDPSTGEVGRSLGGQTTRFDAPKTQVMKIVIDGVLTRKLNWSLVLIGAMIAVTLELCGVSSLAFAVGMYVPIQFSVPIFLGGILRWGIDKWQARRSAASVEAAGNDPEARAKAEIEAIRRSETSPGVLLASGYIAGGSIAGVVAAFLEFSPSLKGKLDYTKVVESMGWGADAVAIALFAVLIVFAVLVGTEQFFKPPAEETAQH
jgi:putative OPT family oligopeptide transporter